MSENSALRTLLHFVAEDLKVADERKERNPVQLTTDIRNAIAIRDRRIAELEKESNDFDTEMAIVAKALTAAFEDGRLNANDKRNEQLSDIAESKKWQTEQVDTLRERIAELEAALKYVKDTITHDANGYDAADCIDNAMAGKACALDALLVQAELKGWQRCIDAVRGSVDGYPNQGGDTVIMAAIDKLLAQARREALEEAAARLAALRQNNKNVARWL